MANVNTKARVLVRDGFRCQYCGTTLYLAQAVKVLDMEFEGLNLYDRHGKFEPLRSRWATVDHVVPDAAGGLDTLDNLVACCVACNSRKGKDCAESIVCNTQGIDPWDGLSGVFLALAPTFEARLSREDHQWRLTLQREDLQPSVERLDETIAELRRMRDDVRNKT